MADNNGHDRTGRPVAEPLRAPVQRLLAPNDRGRDLFVGDIQGYCSHLLRLLDRLGFDPSCDRLIAVGDLVDRGPESMDALRLYARSHWFHSVLGNHDAMALACLGGAAAAGWRTWIWNGGGWLQPGEPEAGEACTILRGLPLSIEVPLDEALRVGVVHAELPSDMHWGALAAFGDTAAIDAFSASGDSVEADLLWARRRCTRALGLRAGGVGAARSKEAGLQPVAGIDLLVSGHTRVMSPAVPLRGGNQLWIDTGSDQPGGALTIVDPLHGRYWQLLDTASRLPADCRFAEGELMPALLLP